MSSAQLKLNLPQGKGTAVTKHGNFTITVEVGYDQNCDNPLDNDGMGSIRSLSRRHSNSIGAEEFEALTGFNPATGEFKGGDQDAVVLSYFEHGNHLWFVKGETPCGVEYRWDGVRVAGVWQPDDVLLQEVKGLTPAKRLAKMVEFARQACTEFTAWGNGECYYFNVKVVDENEQKLAGDDTAGILEESCGGFIGWEYFENEVQEVAASLVAHALAPTA
jgi:hypothetical protein